MVSIGTMIKQCEGLIGTKDISEWEGDFIESILEKTLNGATTISLSLKQVEIVERIYKKHF